MSSSDDDDDEDDYIYLEGLKEEVVEIIFKPFNELENHLDEFYNRWKSNLQKEKKILIETLCLGNINEKIEETFVNKSADVLREEIEYFNKVLDKVQPGLSIKKDTTFCNVLQYKGDAVHWDIHVQAAAKCDSSSDSDDNINDVGSDNESVKSYEDAEAQEKMQDSMFMASDAFNESEELCRSSPFAGSGSIPQQVDSQTTSSLDGRRIYRAQADGVVEQSGTIDVQGIKRHIRKSNSTRLHCREETVRAFLDLRNQLTSPKLTHTTEPDVTDKISLDFQKNTKDNAKEVVCREYQTIDRNWIDILLFQDCYLVTIQKKDPKTGNNEFLNKYSKETGELLKWMWLPEAGRMCKINEKEMNIAVLQIGRKRKCIAVIKTGRPSVQAKELQILYCVNVHAPFFLIACLGQSQINSSSNLKLVAVFSALRNGKTEEEIYTLVPNILSLQKVGGGDARTYNATTTLIKRHGGICGISTFNKDKIIMILINSVACIDIHGAFLWILPTQARVTDICSQKNFLFVCLQDKGWILKSVVENNKVEICSNNILIDEVVKPSQVSICGHDMLIREFIPDEYRSKTIVRIVEL